MKKRLKKSQVGCKVKAKLCEMEEGEKLFVGIDVHKRQHHVAVWSSLQEKVIKSWVGTESAEAITKSLEPYRSHIVRIVYEAGPTGFTLARRLQEMGWPVEVVSAAHTPVLPGEQDKSDRLDANKLAIYTSKNLLRSVYILTEQEEHDRALFRNRDRIIRHRRRIKQQIKGFLLYHGIAEPPGLKHWSTSSIESLKELSLSSQLSFCLDKMLRELSSQSTYLKGATTALSQLAGTKRYRDRVTRMMTVPGVGELTSMAFLLEMPNLERFSTPRQVARMLGLSPKIRSSGETVHQQGRHHAGLSRLRTLLIEASWQWQRRDPLASSYYRRIVSNTGSGKKAITALTRKLGIILWRIATDSLPYCPGLLNIPDSVAKGMIRKESVA